MDDSGPCHTRSCGVDVLVKKEREASPMSHVRGVARAHSNKTSHYFDDEDDLEDMDPYDDDFELNISEPPPRANSSSSVGRRRKKGKDGRFVSSVSSSKRISKKQRQSVENSWLVKGPIPGGPHDASVIPSFAGHVATRIWDGDERNVLKCHTRSNACTTLVDWRGSLSAELRAKIDATGLAHLPFCMFKHIDMPLISAFVERWQPDTNSFHLPFGEMTIMLHDVWQILRIPIDGRLVSAQGNSEQMQFDFIELFGVTLPKLLAPPNPHWGGGGVLVDSIVDFCDDPQRPPNIHLVGWMLLMLGTSLFVDKSGNKIRASNILEVKDGVTHISDYSWGSAALAYLYRQLGIASRSSCASICGCLTLLQAWIYEYFPCFRPHRERMICTPTDPRARMWSIKLEGKDDVRLHSFRNRLDQMSAAEVTWLPYGPDPAVDVPRTLFLGWLQYRDISEPYMPDRVLRQLGYVQLIPSPIARPQRAYRPANSTMYEVEFPGTACESAWQMFPRGNKLILSEFHRSADPSACTPDYLNWFYRYSHPRVVNQDIGNVVVIPDRTNTAWWMNRMFRIIQPWMDDRDKMPSDESKAAAEKMDELIRDWNLAK